MLSALTQGSRCQTAISELCTHWGAYGSLKHVLLGSRLVQGCPDVFLGEVPTYNMPRSFAPFEAARALTKPLNLCWVAMAKRSDLNYQGIANTLWALATMQSEQEDMRTRRLPRMAGWLAACLRGVYTNGVGM